MPRKKRSGSYSKNKGSAYERQIVNELKELFHNESICTSRSVSKKLDNMKIDIFDGEDVLPCYFQLKKTQTTPSIKKINATVGKKDKPLCILWNIQQKKEGNVNITSAEEYAIIPKNFFYKLLEKDTAVEENEDKERFMRAMMDFISDMPTDYEPIIHSMGISSEKFYDLLDSV